MSFWSTNFGENTDLKDPKRKFRFTVEISGISATQGGQAIWYAKTVSKPSFAIATAEHKYLNHTFYYPGSVTWNEVDLTLVDPVDPDMAATLSDIVVKSGYSPPTNATDLVSMSKAKSAGSLGTVIITQIDSEGNALEKWTLWNSFITELKYGDLEYGGDDLTEMSVKIRYDWARVQTPQGKSSAVAGTGESSFFDI
tara:strand:+ start:2933 stop:3523 length:591 start_codon:yes stop_codon:yes gene_type:complete